MTYYVTFGQRHPLRKGYIEVEAPDYESAKAEVDYIFGDRYSFIRVTDDIKRGDFFPAGRFGEILIAPQVYE